jgi:transcriptional regulator with XRE-family HTH domain
LDLKQYIETRNFQMQEFAELVNISKPTLSNYVHKRRRPRLDIAQRIVKATKGKVTIEDLLGTLL